MAALVRNGVIPLESDAGRCVSDAECAGSGTEGAGSTLSDLVERAGVAGLSARETVPKDERSVTEGDVSVLEDGVSLILVRPGLTSFGLMEHSIIM